MGQQRVVDKSTGLGTRRPGFEISAPLVFLVTVVVCLWANPLNALGLSFLNGNPLSCVTVSMQSDELVFIKCSKRCWVTIK